MYAAHAFVSSVGLGFLLLRFFGFLFLSGWRSRQSAISSSASLFDRCGFLVTISRRSGCFLSASFTAKETGPGATFPSPSHASHVFIYFRKVELSMPIALASLPTVWSRYF